MTLCEFLDAVRFGAVGRLCIAIRGEEDYLDNFQEGMYWELECGNWHKGSQSPTMPDLPKEIMDAEVTQVECIPNLPKIYANLDNLGYDNHHFTVILVEKPYGFNAEEYWNEDNMGETWSRSKWHYAISEETWKEIQHMDANWRKMSLAIATIPYYGLALLREYTEEDFDEMDAEEEAVFRLAQKIAKKISNLNELSALLQLTGSFSAFTE